MPVVTISHVPSVSQRDVEALQSATAFIVPRALACEEEGFDGVLRPGDLVLRSRPDLQASSGLSALVEVHTRYFASRARDIDDRAAVIRDHLRSRTAVAGVAVWVSLMRAGWSQP